MDTQSWKRIESKIERNGFIWHFISNLCSTLKLSNLLEILAVALEKFSNFFFGDFVATYEQSNQLHVVDQEIRWQFSNSVVAQEKPFQVHVVLENNFVQMCQLIVVQVERIKFCELCESFWVQAADFIQAKRQIFKIYQIIESFFVNSVQVVAV